MKCPKCGYPVLPKFAKCPHCGDSLVKEDGKNANSQEADNFSVVKGRAIWNIQKGEIAHLIKESELVNTDGLKGVIVPERCTAVVMVDSQVASIMQPGAYSFPIKEKVVARKSEVVAERKPTTEATPATSKDILKVSSALGRGIRNFLFGKKTDEKPEQHEKRVVRTTEKISKVPDFSICRIYMVSSRQFNIFFDLQVDEDGNYDFAPFVIPTKTVDVNIAVSLQLQVTNMSEFVCNYLADQQSVGTILFQQQLRSCVKSTLTQLLRNLDYLQDGLPEPVVNNLKNRIRNACNEQLYGIEVAKVLDIADSSNDFNRFRSAERELFVNEKELDYLARTNEFRNRIEQEKNKEEVNKAVNAESLRLALQKINKDKLLSEDEMEQFVMMMDSQKRLREAKTKQEENEALADMKKSQLVKEEDLAALENVLAQNKVSRDNIVDLMRAQAEQDLALTKQIAEFKLSDSKRDHDLANELEEALHKGQLANTQMNTQRLLDAYQDERRKKEDDYSFAQEQRKDDYLFQRELLQDDRDFNKQKRQSDWEFSSLQRQQEADFKARVQNEDYDFQSQQREDEHQFEQDKRNLQTRIQNEDYDFQKQQREDDRDFSNRQRQQEADFKARVQNEDYDFQSQQREDEHQFEQDKRNLQTRIQNEDYDFQKKQREQTLKEQQAQADYARQRQEKFDGMDLLERKAAIAQRNMQTMKQAEMAELQENNRSAETMQQMALNAEMNRDSLFANMTAEQIRAAQLSHLSSEAQTEMAKSYSSEKENGLRAQQQAEQKVLYEQMMQNQMAQSSQNQEIMMKMAQMMQQGMIGVGQQQMAAQQQRFDDQVAIKNEYRENAIYQQQRTDHTQDRALDNIGKVSTAAANNLNTSAVVNQQYRPTQPVHTIRNDGKTCPSCGAEIELGEAFCPECGSRV
jgi:hypothetical protein